MSALGHQEVLKPILLRSSTPAPNEKVLNYLEGMSSDQPDNSPPRSLVDPNEYRSKAGSTRVRSPPLLSPRSKNGDALFDGPNSPINYTNRNGIHAGDDDQDDVDVASNVQDGVRSEAGDTILRIKEPGPHDPPGPKYESYDSGPSFGNFGPLPVDEHPSASNNPYANGGWNMQSKPPQQNPTALTEGGQAAYSAGNRTPGYAARVPLPASEFAFSPRGTNVDLGTPGNARSRQSPEHDGPPTTGPRSTGKGVERPWSPLSGRSFAQGTAYPPLPESRIGDDETNVPGSPRARSQVRSKAASVTPSESLSQVRVGKTPSRKNTNKSSADPAAGPSSGEFTPRNGSRLQMYNGLGRSQAPGSVMSGSHHSRPFSPYRHGPTTEDLLHAAIRGRALAIPEEDEKSPSIAAPSPRSKAASQISKVPSQVNGKAPSSPSVAPRPPSATPSQHMHGVSQHEDRERDGDATPRPLSPEELDPVQVQIVNEALAGRTPRTSYYAASLEPEVANHFHDMELCVLLHQENDPTAHDFVKKALRKAIRQRVKKLGMKYDNESIRQYRKSYHDHDPSVHLRHDFPHDQEPPQWASDIKRELVLMQQRIESLGPKIEELRPANRSFVGNESRFAYEGDETTQTPITQTVNIQTQRTGTAADSMYQGAQSEVVIGDGYGHHHHEDEDGFDQMTETQARHLHTDGETRTQNRSAYGMSEDRDDSPGQQFLEEELYRLRQRPQGSRLSHHTWEVARERDMDDYDEDGEHQPPSGMPTIPDSNGGGYPEEEQEQEQERSQSRSPPLPALPDDEVGGVVTTPQGPWNAIDYSGEVQNQMTPWQRIHQRLLSWAVIWPASELDQALNSTTRGHQVDEVALSIWSTQTYKRYVRARLTDSPPGVVDRLFVPPNMADAISNAVFNGQHGNACGMLRDLWTPFGLPGMPRLLVVLAKHRSEADHWVVHRYSLPDGTLMTYDSFAGRTLMDGRPLGWWFAIRIAWPNANYPSPDHLEQKMVRLHRPMQLPIDNSVAAAGIWRNILMGSRGERSLDLERLRDLINTEVKNLRQRKQLGRLSIGAPRQAWEHMN